MEEPVNNNRGLKEARKKALLTLGAVVVLIIVLYFVANAITTYTGYSIKENVDEFAKCLSEKGAVMYGTDSCHFCQEQKKLFGDSFEYINYVNCDSNGEECISKGIAGYPTWIIDEEAHEGVQDFDMLAEYTGCKIS